MTIANAIQEKMRLLPEQTQKEVLDFVDYLLYRSRREERSWSQLSVMAALRGLEEEEWPNYGDQDLKERWT